MKRRSAIVAIIMTVVLTVAMTASSVEMSFASPSQSKVSDTDSISSGETAVWVNPVYKGIVSEEYLRDRSGKAGKRGAALQSAPDFSEYTDDEQAIVNEIRRSMVNRETRFSVYYRTYGDCELSQVMAWIESALEETDSPVEGDYLRWVCLGWMFNSYVTYMDGVCYAEIVIDVDYYTTREQEEELTEKLDRVMQSFGFGSSTTDLEKIRKIYDYVCHNVTYDYANLNDDSYMLKYTAYAALMNGTAVCQGYSSLLYRMLRTAGISARVITGTGNGGPHAWNIVKVGDKYYNCDSTWDSERSTYEYFLKGSGNFGDHQTGEQYLTKTFMAAYPVSFADYGEQEEETIVSGDFIFTVWYGTVGLSGYTGSGSDVTVPSTVKGYPVTSIWSYAFDGADTIKTLTVSEGIKDLGAYSIYNMQNLRVLNLPSTVYAEEPGSDQYGITTGMSGIPAGCPLLEEVTVPEGSQYLKSVDGVLFYKDMTEILYYPSGKKDQRYTVPDGVVIVGASAFENHQYIQSVYMPDTVEYIGYRAFAQASALQEIRLSENTKAIGEFALNGTALQEIYFPASLEYFNPSWADFPCLKAWTVPEDNEAYSAAGGVLLDKEKKELINIPGNMTGKYVVPDTVTSIYTHAARSIALSSIEIPQGTTIGSENFENRPEGFTIYGFEGSHAEAFARDKGINFVSIGSAEETEADSGVCGENVRWTLSTTGVLRISGAGEMQWEGAGTMWADTPWEDHRPDVTKVIIEDGVENIPGNSFNNFQAITEVILPGSVKVIGSQAFYCCSSLKYIEIPEGVRKIDSNAFGACDSLKYAVIPASVEILDQQPFMYNDSMTEIRVDKNNKNFKDVDGVLLSKDGKTLLQYPAGKGGAYTVPDSVETIDTYSFTYAIADTVTIPDTVKEIGKGAFYYSRVKGIVIGSGVTEIPDGMFFCCEARKVAIGKNVRSIGRSAFTGMNDLTAVYFAGAEAEWNNITIAEGNDAFQSCDIIFGKVSSFCDIGIHAVTVEPEKEPTCTESGHFSYFVCSECGKIFNDCFGIDEMTDISGITIPAVGHSWDKGVVTREPTYTEEGEKTYTCKVCGKTRTETVAKLIDPFSVKVTISAPAAGKGAITVKWKKVSADVRSKISGYQIQYSLKKNFKSAKTVKAGKNTTSKKIKKLKNKKVYYVRIRTYQGSKYGPWSAVKKVKTK